MSNQINDGGPAFARDSHMDKQIGLYVQQHGMSLRDYFAAAALQGMMAAHTSGGCLVDDLYAKYAYDLADAMIQAREAKP